MISIVGMTMPIYLEPGVIFDARSVILSVGALFGGPIVGGIAALIAIAFRFWLGGAGAVVGIGLIVMCVAVGLAFRYAIKSYLAPDRWWTYAMFSVAVHLAALGFFLALPSPISEKVFANISIPFFVVLTPCAFILSSVIKSNERISGTLPATAEGPPSRT